MVELAPSKEVKEHNVRAAIHHLQDTQKTYQREVLQPADEALERNGMGLTDTFIAYSSHTDPRAGFLPIGELELRVGSWPHAAFEHAMSKPSAFPNRQSYFRVGARPRIYEITTPHRLVYHDQAHFLPNQKDFTDPYLGNTALTGYSRKRSTHSKPNGFISVENDMVIQVSLLQRQNSSGERMLLQPHEIRELLKHFPNTPHDKVAGEHLSSLVDQIHVAEEIITTQKSKCRGGIEQAIGQVTRAMMEAGFFNRIVPDRYTESKTMIDDIPVYPYLQEGRVVTRSGFSYRTHDVPDGVYFQAYPRMVAFLTQKAALRCRDASLFV